MKDTFENQITLQNLIIDVIEKVNKDLDHHGIILDATSYYSVMLKYLRSNDKQLEEN